jgi:hypothetical protein
LSTEGKINFHHYIQLIWAPFFNVYGSVHCNNILIYIQQDATLHSLFYLETALHVLGDTTTYHQDRKKLYLQHLVFVTPLLLPATVVEELWQIPGAVDTVVCTPDDGWWYHPKHVEQFPDKINCVTLNLVGYILEYWALFFTCRLLTKEENIYGHFMQYNTMDHTANLSMSAVDEVFEKQLISSDCGSLNSQSESLLLMWGMLEDRVARTARLYSKWNWKHFKTRMPMCAEKHFRRMQGLLWCWRFTLKDCALEKVLYMLCMFYCLSVIYAMYILLF